MDSPEKDLIKFDEAVGYMDPFELKHYLEKTLSFLNRNNTECCFPNILPYIETFLVGLVSDMRNLKSKLLNSERKLALDIIEALELNKDVFRWTYAYENGKVTKNLLVYKKIYTNKMKMKPTEFKMPASSISQRLIQTTTQEQSHQVDIPTGCKIQLLNATQRFLKNSAESTLHYPDMPTAQAQFMCTLINNPKDDLNVGFGFKSIYAPLFEAMNVCGADYELKIWYDVAEKSGSDVAYLKLQKISRKETSVVKNVKKANSLEQSPRSDADLKNSNKDNPLQKTTTEESKNSLNSSLNSSTSSTRSRDRRRRSKVPLLDRVGAAFTTRTLQDLLAFTTDASRASVTFEGLTDAEAAFVKGVKSLASSSSSHGSLAAALRSSLQRLDASIAEVMKTCKIRIEDGRTEDKARFITLKKIPREVVPSKPLSLLKPQLRSKSAAAASSTSNDNLIQFKSAGKLNPVSGEIEAVTDKPGSGTDNPLKSVINKDRLNKRQAKLLQAMSVPVDSDKGKRMMELMGWAGGALGAREDGILEPLLPAIDLPAGAGLGHVPPPKPETRSPEDFRLSLLHNIRDLILHPPASKLVEYKLPLSKKERNFINGALSCLNHRKALGLSIRAEQDLAQLLLREMTRDRDLEVRAEISKDLRKVTLVKSKNSNQKFPLKLQLSKLKMDLDPITMTVLNTRADYELITDDVIKQVMATITYTTCKTPAARRGRAMRMLFLRRFNDLVRGHGEEKEFRFVGVFQKKLMTYLQNVIACVNYRVRCSYVADEEVCLYDDLMQSASERGCYLEILFESPSNFLLRKMSDKTVQPKPAHDSNNNQRSIHIHIGKTNDMPGADNDTAPNGIITKETPKHVNFAVTFSTLVEEIHKANRIVENCSQKGKDVAKVQCVKEADGLVENVSLNSKKVPKITNETDTKQADRQNSSLEVKNVAENQTKCANGLQNDNLIKDKKDTEIETKCDVKLANRLVQNGSLKVKEVPKITSECDLKHANKKVQNDCLTTDVAKMQIDCDIEHKENNVINSVTIDKDAPEFNRMQEIKTDDGRDNSWSTCSDNELDISELGQDIEDLDKALSEIVLDLNVNKKTDASVSPKSINSANLNGKNNILVIAPKSPTTKMNLDLVKKIQTLILKEINKEKYLIPLLKCHGVQETGLIYSCHDEKDVSWLKKVINIAKLDLEITDGTDDCIEDRKSRKMAIKINSFITLDTKEVFSKIELYNRGINTKPWKILTYELYSDFILLIVEVDEKSYEYISDANFSLYMGIDKAQFSIIF